MRLLGLVGSPRKDGNSFHLVRESLGAAEAAESSLQTEIIQLADLNIESCRACENCAQKPHKCVIEDDFGSLLGSMKAADGIVIASPKYGPLGTGPSKMQALLERLVNLNHLPPQRDPNYVFPLKDKPCGLLAVSVEGRQNNLPLLHSLEQYVLCYRMRVLHLPQWPWVGVAGRGNHKGEVLNDGEAVRNARQLGLLMVEELRR